MIDKVINKLKMELPATVKLVAVSKFHPFESIEQAYEAGQRCFAESRPQELVAKMKTLESRRIELGDPSYMSDLEWHFIGHLQTNKLKMVLPHVSLVESVDSVRLLEAIDSWGRANNLVSNILLECFISRDETKQGLSKEEVSSIIADKEKYDFVNIKGVMGMASYTDDESIIREEFGKLAEIASMMGENTEISMGMSGDYPIAIEMGSTMVRIGSMIFGERN